MIVHNPNNLPVIPIQDLLPTQGDLKDLSETNYKKLKNTIERRGFSYPVYVWESAEGKLYLLDGHQRQRVLNKEKWTEPIPYLKVPAENLQEAMARLLEITSQYATITQEGIDEFIATYDLNESEVYESTSFDALAFERTEIEQEIEEDEVPEVDDKEPPKSKLGEIYQLGRHRVMCGDSTSPDTTDTLLDKGKVDLVFSDPPYGIDVVNDEMVGADFGVAKKGKYHKVINDDTTDTAEKFFDVVKPRSAKQIIWGGNYFTSFLPFSDGWIIWDKRGDSGIKNTFADGEMAWCSFHTPIRIYTQLWNGMIREGEKDKRLHPTQKPLKTLSSIIKDFSSKDNLVYDGFLGSGSTLIACEQTDRTCYGMELDPKYIDVIRKRWAKFTNNNELPDNWEELTKAL